MKVIVDRAETVPMGSLKAGDVFMLEECMDAGPYLVYGRRDPTDLWYLNILEMVCRGVVQSSKRVIKVSATLTVHSQGKS